MFRMLIMAFKKMAVSKKPTLTFLILKSVFDLGAITIDSFFPSKYPQTKIWRQMLGLDKSYKFSRQSFSTILTRLQKQGLVERKSGKWSNTKIGTMIVKKARFRPPELPLKDGIIRLVIFDIPERDRKKRLWLRKELLACDFQLLQKSVWIGYRPLPKDFYESLEDLNLRSYIHIFSIKQAGTLKEETN